jgi:hypothetical protein
MALPTNQAIAPTRNTPELRHLNQEQPFSPIYHYAFVTDAVEGLIAVNVDTLADGEFRNNFFRRALTFNPDGVLTGRGTSRLQVTMPISSPTRRWSPSTSQALVAGQALRGERGEGR